MKAKTEPGKVRIRHTEPKLSHSHLLKILLCAVANGGNINVFLSSVKFSFCTEELKELLLSWKKSALGRVVVMRDFWGSPVVRKRSLKRKFEEDPGFGES